MTEQHTFRYRAFISYSHQDERWAGWLHKALERYRIPRRLVGQSTSAGVVPPRIAPVFRDREELPTATNLSRVIVTALEQSEAMIVICSPAAARSPWVNEEIRVFRRLGRADRIFCLIVAGLPEAAGPDQCFPDALRATARAGDGDGETAAEPIGADVRPGKDRGHSALLKLVAGLLGIGLDEIVRRDLQRRNHRLVGITAAAVAGMAVASLLAAVALFARNEAERQRMRAETAAATAQQTSEFLVQLFQVVDPSEARGASITAREILDRGAARIDRDLAAQPVVRANLLQTMGRVYTGLGLYQSATDLLKGAMVLRDDLKNAPTPEAIATANALGAALRLKGEYDAAAQIYGDALTAATTLHGDGDAQVTEAINGIADVLIEREDFAAAERRYSEALAIDRRLHGKFHPDVARSLSGRALALMYQERFGDSEEAFRESLAIRKESLGDDHPLVAETINNLASLLYFAGRGEEAEPFFREAAERYRQILGPEHPFVSSILNNLGRLLLERGDLGRAEQLLDDALAMDRKFKDPNHDELVYTLNNLGLVKLGLGRTDAAISLLQEALGIAEAHSHRMLGQVWASLADAYWRARRSAEALDAIEHARPLLAADYPDEPWYAANLASIEGAVLVTEGAVARAEPLLVASYPVVADRWGEDGLFTRLAAARMAVLYDAHGDTALAAQYRATADAGGSGDRGR